MESTDAPRNSESECGGNGNGSALSKATGTGGVHEPTCASVGAVVGRAAPSDMRSPAEPIPAAHGTQPMKRYSSGTQAVLADPHTIVSQP